MASVTLTRSLEWTQNFLLPGRNPLRGAQFPAVLLLVAAALGLLTANIPLHDPIAAVLNTHIAVPGTGIDLSVAHWISDGLLAIFFFVVAVELATRAASYRRRLVTR